MDRITLRPATLAHHALVTTEVAADLQAAVGLLRDAPDTLRASHGWWEHLDDVPPYDLDLGVLGDRLGELGSTVGMLAARARSLDDRCVVELPASHVADLQDLFAAPVLPDLRRVGDRWVLSTGDRGDHVQVVERPDGSWAVRVSSQPGETGCPADTRLQPLTDEQAARLVIRTEGGNDVVQVPSSARLRLTVWTGDGDDRVTATRADHTRALLGGGGPETVFLGDGDDLALGGAGDDRLYGGGGRDSLHGQAGDDLLVGGAGFDVLHGGRGRDRVAGGRGRDQISGGTQRGSYTETWVDGDGTELATAEVPMAEVNAVGLDLDGDGDIDTQPSRGGRDHPGALTENALRAALGSPLRRAYARRPDHVDADGSRVEVSGVKPAPAE